MNLKRGDYMKSHTETTEKAYATKELAVMLDIAVPTVRKYALSLESMDYKFIRSESGARLFIEKDIMALRYLKELRDKTNIKVEQATNIVIEKFGKGAIQDIMPTNTEDIIPYDKQYKNDMNELKEMIKDLSNKVDQQQVYIKDHLEQRDQLLMQTLNNTLETKKELAAATENASKKSWWNRLFSK